MPAIEQLTVLVAAMEGQFDGLSEAESGSVMSALRKSAARDLQGVAKHLRENAALTDDDRQQMTALGRAARAHTGGGHGTKS